MNSWEDDMAVDYSGESIVKRHEKNPVLTAEQVPFPCHAVFNAAAVKRNGEYILLFRAERPNGTSCIGIARSRDGIDFAVADLPAITPAEEEPFAEYETFGVEDPRITKIDGTYYITYTAYSRHGPRTALASTTDFEQFSRVALISGPENKNIVLFPERFDGRFVRYDRPISERMGRADIWVSYSPDLVHWGESEVLMESRTGLWDGTRVGAGAPPVKTEQGWLLIYHGVADTVTGSIYRLGCALFDLGDPSKLLGRGEGPVLAPREGYEQTGQVPNTVFSCGVIAEKRTGELRIYYTGADTCLCLATAEIDKLVGYCLQ